MRLLRTVDKGVVDVIRLDAVITMEVTHAMTLTEHPIEDGSLVADHVRSSPVQITVTGLVSNTPIKAIGMALVRQADATRRQTAYEALLALERKKETVQIESELAVYPDMMLTELRVPRNRTNFHALEFAATFQQVQKVGLQTVALKDDEQVKALATPAADVGSVEAEIPDKSTLARVVDWAAAER